MKYSYFIVFTLCLTLTGYTQDVSQLEVVSSFAHRPGNVAVSSEGRVFCTMHPLGSSDVQLVEITGIDEQKPFPSSTYQKMGAPASLDKIDTPLGIRIDNNDVLWIVDMGQNLGVTRVFGFDVNTRQEVFQHTFSEAIAPPGSFIQDLAVDEINGWIYLADIADPGIVALDMNNKTERRFSDQTFQAEPVDMVINGQLVYFAGAPASVAINPITLSADRNTMYFGAMNGITWYQVSAELFREGASDYSISNAIKIAGPKPVSDGAATDHNGHHYFTNINHNGIDRLSATGDLQPIIRDPKIDWADNVAVGPNGDLFINVNQLHKTPAFTGSEDQGTPPYYIYVLRKE